MLKSSLILKIKVAASQRDDTNVSWYHSFRRRCLQHFHLLCLLRRVLPPLSAGFRQDRRLFDDAAASLLRKGLI